MMHLKDNQGKWIVYILTCQDGSFYTGITNNIEKRLFAHQQGKGSKYTRSRLPVKLSVASTEMSRREAMLLELKIKKLPKAKKIAMLSNPIIS